MIWVLFAGYFFMGFMMGLSGERLLREMRAKKQDD